MIVFFWVFDFFLTARICYRPVFKMKCEEVSMFNQRRSRTTPTYVFDVKKVPIRRLTSSKYNSTFCEGSNFLYILPKFPSGGRRCQEKTWSRTALPFVWDCLEGLCLTPSAGRNLPINFLWPPSMVVTWKWRAGPPLKRFAKQFFQEPSTFKYITINKFLLSF